MSSKLFFRVVATCLPGNLLEPFIFMDSEKEINIGTKEKYNLMAVKGNVDALVDNWVLPYPLPEYAVYENNGFRIVIYHGHQHEFVEERVDFASRFGADMLIFGYTHLPLLEEKYD